MGQPVVFLIYNYRDYAEFVPMTTFSRDVRIITERFPVDTIKNTLRKASNLTQSEAVSMRRNTNNT